jgi:membrane-bound serine protease (ClpP class)
MVLAVALLGLGIAFVIAEVLFPSFGVLSICATISIVAACVTAFDQSTQAGVGFLVATAVLVPAGIMFGLKLFPKSPLGKHMVAPGLSFESQAATDARDLALVGAEGEIESDCRPTGVARLAGRRIDVTSRGELIERGARVRVLEVKGNRVVVARIGTGADEGSVS